MQTALQQPYSQPYTREGQNASIWARFISWCKDQEENRLLWLGIGLVAHSCFFAPLTLFVIMYTGNNLVLFGFAIAAIAMSLVTNLAALPTKITIPTLFFSIILDVAIIVAALSMWL